VTFKLNGQSFVALNGGPQFKFNESISFVINCETSQDVDYYWSKLTEGGQPGPCGWLKDKYGLSWQVVPTGLDEVLGDKDPARAKRAMEAMLKMSKLDLDAMKRAANGWV
jgi:predicted 3-demethylubiquinone-9 3-methyltransferase (glyoxalase superfamily)